ncbi:hypothetical protein [Undibacterium sp.]|jgi:succinate dehydrogenase/fumarate reductase cytochrome b subunit|uniref:hypothetical protein n=1 Tax=Undibacterium sp. TaxID=1914977 RepID=UPI002BB7C1F0|nr:hypothetical protein [Undibacterium sp.]HTD04445.1 hypothetical protein [Undibacterium sp.]
MLHRWHRLSACVIGAYVLVHVFNHLLALGSVQAHIGFMDAFRKVYRTGAVEVLLLACVAFQIGSGLHFLRARWGQRHGFFDRLQAISGAYLAFFLVVHVSAVLFGRSMLGLDTNFYYAAAGMHVAPYGWFFVPYYFLAVAAIFGHLACAFHWLTRERLGPVARKAGALGVLGAGLLTATLIVAAFSGVSYPVTIPAKYLVTYQR